MLRIKGLVCVVVVSSLTACSPPPPEPVALGPAGVDFIARDLVLDLRVQNDWSAPIVQPWRLGDGWERPTADGVWAVGRVAEFEADVHPDVRFIRVECRAFHGLEGEQHVDVFVGDALVGTFDPAIGPLRWYEIPVPPSGEGSTARNIRFEFARARSPFDAGIGKDTRQLALFVRRILFVSEGPATGSPAGDPDIETTENGWQVHRPGRLLVNLGEGNSRLEFIEVGCGEAQGAANCTVFLTNPMDGTPISDVEQAAVNGKPGTVRFTGDGLRGPLQVVVDALRAPTEVVVQAANASSKHAPPDRSQKGAQTQHPQPDIVVIILDATRADHAGAQYGYARETLSRIGRWMKDALVFERVFAQAPYTSCSVPTMFTGVDFTSHGVIRSSDRLHEDELTLAESLRSAGYRTVGFTATPNNSTHLGMAQGFDEFTQIWEGVDWLTSIDPFFMAEAVKRRLEEDVHDAPLFLMVHLVPPHSPYTPPERYRVFSDPAYQGPADGSQAYLSSIRGRPEAVSEDDLEQLIALYDANLVYADTATDSILQALSDAGRFEESVILVTSDHGEAFFEHGQESHNSTVYDEMLHVPFLLRLPGGVQPGEIDLNRFASLEDLTPTLLAFAGVSPGQRATGVDLLGETKRKYIILRSADQQKITGFRSGRYKVIADRWGRIVELYDLENDPEEHNNLFIDRLETVSWLASEWRKALASAPARLAGGERDVTDAEREMLEQLGYIE